MAYAMYVAAPRGKRLKSIDDKGVEAYEQTDYRRWVERAHPTQYKLLEERAAEDAQPTTEDDSDKPPTPAEALEKIQAALSELDVIMDVVNLLEGQQMLAAKSIQKLRTTSEAKQEMLRAAVKERTLRIGRRQAALSAVAQRLRAGAGGLRAQCARENSFYMELAKLQRFWKVLPGQHIDRPFTVDLSYGRLAAELLVAAASQSPSLSTTVDVVRDPLHGIAAVAPSELPTQPPSTEPQPEAAQQVAVGTAAAHQLLLKQQRRLLHAAIREELVRDSAGPIAPAFLASLAQLVAEALDTASKPQLAVLRPLLMDYFHKRVVEAATSPPVAPQAPSVLMARAAGTGGGRAAHRKRNLLLDLTGWLAHMSWRHFVRSSLDMQSVAHPGVVLSWTPSWTPCTSVVQLRLSPSWVVLVLIRDALGLDVEGGMAASHSRWARDAHFSASKHDVPALLAQIQAMAHDKKSQ